MAYNPNFETIGNAFVQHYYKQFDVGDGEERVKALDSLYDPNASFLTFEGSQFNGKKSILEKFEGLPFRSIQHAITKTDCQPLADGSIVVVVFGQLKTDDDPINSFNHTFVLRNNGVGSFFISNEVFRLILHNIC